MWPPSPTSIARSISPSYPSSLRLFFRDSDFYLQQELPVAFVTFKSQVGVALAAQARHHLHAFVWITEEAPEPRDMLLKNFSNRSRKLLVYKIGFFVAASLLTLCFALPVTVVQGIANFEKLKKWFVPAIAIELM